MFPHSGGGFLARRMVTIACFWLFLQSRHLLYEILAAMSLLLFSADLPLDWGATTFSLLPFLGLIFSVCLRRTITLSY